MQLEGQKHFYAMNVKHVCTIVQPLSSCNTNTEHSQSSIVITVTITVIASQRITTLFVLYVPPPVAAAGAFLTPPGTREVVELFRMLGALESMGGLLSSSVMS